MSRRGEQPTCASTKAKQIKTWWLRESRQVLQICIAILLLLTLTLAPWLFIYGGYREHEPRIFVSMDATTPEIYDSEHLSTTHHNPAPPTGCLAMIMKNEGPILPRLFESVRGFVSEYCVVDTGSTDDTIDILRSMEMPGVILEEPFVDFATTRNYMIEKCRQVMTSCDYLVLLDADMVLRVSPEWDWAKLDGQDVYNFIQVSGVEYENVRMIRRNAPDIRVVGATHEYYDVPSGYSKKTLPKSLIHIDDVGDGKAKGDKFERDERLLRRELEEDPENVRAVFYLANTLKDQGKYAEAIPYYVRRATMGGWFAEADYSLYMLSTCYLALDNLDNARKYGELAAFGGMAQRAEPLYFLAFYLSQRRQYSLAWYYASLAAKIPKPAISEALFISYNIYNFWVDYELASLSRHIFPSQPTLGMQAAIAFWNNIYAPTDLRWSFSSIMKSYVRSIGVSVSDTYRLTGGRESGPLAMFKASGVVQLATPDGPARAESIMQTFKIVEMDIQSQLVRELGIVNWRMDAFFEDGIMWQSVGPRDFVGMSPSGAQLYHGEWPGHNDYSIPMHMRQLLVGSGESLLPPAWALVEKEGTTYCVSSWYPVIEVGILKLSSSAAECEAYASYAGTPRSLSFFGPAINSLIYRGDAWFLLRVDAVDAFAVVILAPDFQLKAHTPPFTLQKEDEEGKTALSFDIVMSGDGKENVVFACTSLGDLGFEQLPVEMMLTLMM